DGTLLARLLAASGATLLQATPAGWRVLLESGWAGSADLTALCGGEALAPALAAALLPRTRQLWNLYGPTETAIWSTIERVETAEPITIGRPIANTQVHVVGGLGGLVPVGVLGELSIGGVGVVRGYHGRPDLTAERFVPDPFAGSEGSSGAGGERLYRTGDLARWRTGGRGQCLDRARRHAARRLLGFARNPGRGAGERVISRRLAPPDSSRDHGAF